MFPFFCYLTPVQSHCDSHSWRLWAICECRFALGILLQPLGFCRGCLGQGLLALVWLIHLSSIVYFSILASLWAMDFHGFLSHRLYRIIDYFMSGTASFVAIFRCPRVFVIRISLQDFPAATLTVVRDYVFLLHFWLLQVMLYFFF